MPRYLTCLRHWRAAGRMRDGARTVGQRRDSPRGYWYHDGIRPNNVVSPSPQAIYNASHGVWLWPPKQATRAG